MTGSCTVWILGNQLHTDHPALEAAQGEFSRPQIQVLMIESASLINHYPSHPLRLVLVLSAMRHYAEQLRRSGYQVDYRQSSTMVEALSDHIGSCQPVRIFSMASSNRAGRDLQKQLFSNLKEGVGELLPNQQFLAEEFNPHPDISPQKNIRQEIFYRRLRKHFQVLLTDSQEPTGGKWNYDADNRRRLPADLSPPQIIHFSPDRITREVIQELGASFPDQMEFYLAVDHRSANQALNDFLVNRLEYFGPYQDAMDSRFPVLFHSLLSPYLNLGLLEPLQVVRAVEDAYREGNIPLNSAEGFIRQVLGWREYIYWQYWRQGEEFQDLNFFQAQRDLPDYFWDGKTDLNCLHHALRCALETGYNHHIQRLMIISNFLNLTGVQPRQALTWFMANYIDAYPWVMVPNLIGMGLYADGGRIGTKPYIASANYINKLSDYCQGCSYHHRERSGDQACPYNYLYWNFLITHQTRLQDNPRMNLSLSNLDRIPTQEKDRLQEQAKQFLDKLNT